LKEESKEEVDVFNFLNKVSTPQKQVETNEKKADWSAVFNKSTKVSDKEVFDFRWDSFPKTSNTTSPLKFGEGISSSTNIDYLENEANVLEDVNWLSPGTSNSEVPRGNFQFLEDDPFSELEAQNKKKSNTRTSNKIKDEAAFNITGIIK